MHIDHDHIGAHSHDAGCAQDCASCAGFCEHTPMEELVALMKYMAYKSFSRKGDAIVQMNYNAIDSAAGDNLIKIDIPASWANATTLFPELS